MKAFWSVVAAAAMTTAAAGIMAQPATAPVVPKKGAVRTGSASPAAGVGKKVFEQWCAACHADGPRYPGTASLAVKYGKDLPAALEKRTDLTPETVAYFVRKGVLIMPSFRKTEITDTELAELGTYLSRNTPK